MLPLHNEGNKVWALLCTSPMESMRKVGENKSFKVEEQRLDLKFWHKLDFFFFPHEYGKG